MESRLHLAAEAAAVPRLHITVDQHDLQAGSMRLIREMRPHWDPAQVKLKVFTDGITNKLVGCYINDSLEDVVLVRIYGNKTELFVDRENELKSFRVLYAHGCAPQLYCTFQNGLCYKFVEGTALDPEHIRDPSVYRLITRQLAKIHAIHAHNGWIPKPNLWLKLEKYFTIVYTELANESFHTRFSVEVSGHQELKQELSWMKKQLSNLGSPVVLCHNDLLCKNIIYNEKEGQVKFIDYEYAEYNYQAYDIGNHFNEFAGINEVDYSLYPDKGIQLKWLKSYLEAYKEYKGLSAEITEKDVEELYIQVNLFALASHFFWGLWALIQTKYSTIDFDFFGYAVVRFHQYFKMKPEVMNLKLPE
ncbi:ethanolamine kinase 1 [Pristis pectinata]|uniref:ethanolamine kinase 1 n=1 Tax=Pristis pectinata TaxID=685728 RepID=UPI00223D15F6|nr:ethanolamine kinase 1 [Pristis pectinata]XP_051889994.1 ethanolamine kinase 1 [Pristis pectinata]